MKSNLEYLFMIMSKNKKKVIIAIILLIILIFGLRACGNNSSYDGYYVLEADECYAIQISKEGNVIFSSNRPNWRCSYGYMEKLEDCAALYFTQHYNPEGYIEKYCPLYVTISEDGKRMYLSSDNANWITDMYEIVDEETYNNIITKYDLRTTIN